MLIRDTTMGRHVTNLILARHKAAENVVVDESGEGRVAISG